MTQHATTLGVQAPTPLSAREALTTALQTEATWPATIARVALGVVILPHGLQKTLGLFGGYGWSGTMGFFTQTVGLPVPLAALVILLESLGAVLLIAGALSRPAALGLAAVMTGAVVTSHLPNGFFMNWDGGQAGEGFEFHLLAIGLALVVTVAGGGAMSVDRWLTSMLRRGRA